MMKPSTVGGVQVSSRPVEQQILIFCNWLSQTPLSNLIQSIGWIIPMTQSIHIIAITMVMGSVLMMDMKLLGVVGRGVAVVDMNRRFLPWVWSSLGVLLLTGAILTVAEPGRELTNNAFRLKMALVLTVVVVTGAYQEAVRRAASSWDEDASKRWSGRLLAVVSLCIWVGIVICGRWIAYVSHS